ncbi:MAG: hypothetical protein QF732_06540, partial [Nitrospinaceae bacterium]|nr:hypothetical protein [Nitrospinaceae bacterium]
MPQNDKIEFILEGIAQILHPAMNGPETLQLHGSNHVFEEIGSLSLVFDEHYFQARQDHLKWNAGEPGSAPDVDNASAGRNGSRVLQ